MTLERFVAASLTACVLLVGADAAAAQEQVVTVTLSNGETIEIVVPEGVTIDQEFIDNLSATEPDPETVTAQDDAIAAANASFDVATVTAAEIQDIQNLELTPIQEAVLDDLESIRAFFDFENCVVTVNGQSVNVNPDGSFSLPNISAADQFGSGGPGTAPDFLSDDFVRVLAVCQRGEQTIWAFSEPFQFTQGETFVVSQLTVTTTPPPLPVRISFAESISLITVGETVQKTVTGELGDGSFVDLTPRTTWTVYRTSNPRIASVDQDGLVTGHTPGAVFVTAVNEGTTAVARVDVTQEIQMTTVEGFVLTESGQPVVGAEVTLSGGQAAVSGGDGFFSLTIDVPAELTALSGVARAVVDGATLSGFSVSSEPMLGGITDLGVIIVRPVEVSFGIVASDGSDSVLVFDPETDTVVGSISLPTNGLVGDCSVLSDGSLGFVTDFQNRVWVIDLASSPPSLAAGTNPIFVSNPAEDSSITPDERFLVVCDGSLNAPLSVVDIASRTEVSTISLGSDCNSVEVCDDGSILATSINLGQVRRFTLDDTGAVFDTGDVLPYSSPNNVVCAPGAASGIAIRRSSTITSFTIPGLTPVSTRSLSGSFGLCGLVNPTGERLFVRSNNGAVDMFDYDAASGVIGPAPLLSIPVQNTPTFFGMDQMALHPDGAKLYVPQPGAVNVYDAGTGVLLTIITDPSLSTPTGICIAGGR